MKTCSIADCNEVHYGRTFCNKHYRALMKHGDPLASRRYERHERCTVENCEADHHCRGYCAIHYMRWQRHGDPLVKLTADACSGYIRPDGYRIHFRPDHPLAGTCGKVLEHRMVLFDKIGHGWHTCHWCGTKITWDVRYLKDPTCLVVDHLDHNKLNNHPDNLTQSCNTCNSRRRAPKAGGEQ